MSQAVTSYHTYTYTPLDWSSVPKDRDEARWWLLTSPDPRYFLELCCHINLQGKGKAPFVCMPWMHEVSSAGIGRHEMMLKARGNASSTFWALTLLRKMLTNPGANMVIQANKEDNSANILTIVKFAVEHMPTWIKPVVGRENQTEIHFPKLGSYIRALSGTPTSGRSDRAKYLLATEFAFWEQDEETWGSVYGTLDHPSEPEIVIESTANTQADLFHDFWFDKANGFNKHFYGWWGNPGRDDAWYGEARAKSRSRHLFVRDFPTTVADAFTGSADTYFDTDDIAKGQTFIREPLEIRNVGKASRDPALVMIWERPLPGRHYVIGADVAEGVVNTRGKGDWSNAKVLDFHTGAHVATFQCRLLEDEFGDRLTELAREYNEAHTAVERNNPGLSVIRVMQRHPNNYKNLY